jgi:hypothetical protein
MPKHKQIFLSYSWNDRDVVDSIDNDFKAIGIRLLRDIRDIRPYGSVLEYMKLIGATDFALLIISNSFLKSENCMYEVFYLVNSPEYKTRIIPIVLENAKLFSPEARQEYVKYWRKKVKDTEKEINKGKLRDNEPRIGDLKKYEKITMEIGQFIDIIRDKKCIPLKELQQTHYKAILQLIDYPEKDLLEKLLIINAIGDESEQDATLNTFIKKYPDFQPGRLFKQLLEERRGKSVRDIAGMFPVESLLQWGEYVNIYITADLSPSPMADRLAVHLLKQGNVDDQSVITWFKKRYECWKKLDSHQNVLSLHPRSCVEDNNAFSFLATRYISHSEDLEKLVKKAKSRELNSEFFYEVLKTAANVCRIAHKKGIYLQTLPLRHFLRDQTGKFMLTGFDTAMGDTADSKSIDYWRKFSEDWYTIAPELRTGNQKPNVLSDIFALGVLLKQLDRDDTHPLSTLNDPWACLALHCLSEDPRLRFQSIDHFLTFLESWVINEKTASPIVVPVPEDKPDFWMGKYPVTNFEYEEFCRHYECNYQRPQHHENYQSLHNRLNAPWCPVVDVNLEDAQRYCKWLSKETGEIWRLPTETEWIRAAVLDRALKQDSEKLFPWGNEDPEISPCPCQHPSHRANYENHYGGPTVVGAFHQGCSATGCYDMAGNVWEWCSDYLSPDKPLRILKGGSFDFEARDMQVTTRRGVLLTCRSHHVGFRVVKENKK